MVGGGQPNHESRPLAESGRVGIGQVGRTLRVSRDRTAGTAKLRNTRKARNGERWGNSQQPELRTCHAAGVVTRITRKGKVGRAGPARRDCSCARWARRIEQPVHHRSRPLAESGQRATARRSRNQRSRATKNTRSHKKGCLEWKSIEALAKLRFARAVFRIQNSGFRMINH